MKRTFGEKYEDASGAFNPVQAFSRGGSESGKGCVRGMRGLNDGGEREREGEGRKGEIEEWGKER